MDDDGQPATPAPAWPDDPAEQEDEQAVSDRATEAARVAGEQAVVPETEAADGDADSLLTVLLALGANIGVGILKLIAGLITGSGALLSEAAHSVGDSATELFLLTALRRSARPADRQHPFGYGKERYFWSLIAAVGILVSGAAFSLYQGLHTIFGEANESISMKDALINYVVLALAAVLEGTSLRQGVRQARGEASQQRRTVRSYLRDPDDPTVKSVFLEDSAALVGLALAAVGVAGHQLSGHADWDGAASIAISVLLVFVAFQLASSCKGLLIGKQADVRLIRAIERFLESQSEVVDVVDVLTMMIGTNRILLCVRLDFVDSLSAGDLEQTCVRIEADLTASYPSLTEVFLEPVPRTDAGLRRRVLARYGRVLAEE